MLPCVARLFAYPRPAKPQLHASHGCLWNNYIRDWDYVKTLRLLLVLIFVIAAAAAASDGSAADVTLGNTAASPIVAPMNPRFLAHIDHHNAVTLSSGESVNYGFVPEPFIMPKTADVTIKTMSSLPASYDLRTTGRLSPVKNQGTCGSCWAFAAYGSLESSLLPGELYDFSENNMKNMHGFDIDCCTGGDRAMAAAYLARWDGPISEADDCYNALSCASPTGPLPKKHVQDIVFIADRTGSLDNDALKSAVMRYGAIYTSLYYGNGYYNSSTSAYYCPNSIEGNHAVCIVGWDDNYSSANFTTAPSGNGAFICKNSWTASWGESGYFHVSYYDANIGIENAAFTADAPDNYSTQFGYDKLGLVNTIGYGSNTAWFAMKFTPDGCILHAAAWYTLVNNASYQLKIYANPNSSPTSGKLVCSKVGSIATAGYHTVLLDTPIVTSPGTIYSCVVKLTTPGYNFPIPYDYPDANAHTSTATAYPGETFMSANGSGWTDMTNWAANACACLKAFGTQPNVSDVKAQADGAQVKLTGKVVSGVYSDCIYVREAGEESGIRVAYTGGDVSEGDIVTITGTIGTYKPDGLHPSERIILSPVVTK